MTADLTVWCVGWNRPPHVPDVPPVPVDGGPARLCATCDRNRRQATA